MDRGRIRLVRQDRTITTRALVPPKNPRECTKGNAVKENAMTNETNRQHCCDQQHPSHYERIIDSSDPRTARILEPLTNLNVDFWKSWNAEDVACALACFAHDTLRSLHAGDPNYDEDMAHGHCMLAARR